MKCRFEQKVIFGNMRMKTANLINTDQSLILFNFPEKFLPVHYRRGGNRRKTGIIRAIYWTDSFTDDNGRNVSVLPLYTTRIISSMSDMTATDMSGLSCCWSRCMFRHAAAFMVACSGIQLIIWMQVQSCCCWFKCMLWHAVIIWMHVQTCCCWFGCMIWHVADYKDAS
jgi:hypothetical protein